MRESRILMALILTQNTQRNNGTDGGAQDRAEVIKEGEVRYKSMAGGATPCELVLQLYPRNQKWKEFQDQSKKYGQDCTSSHG